MQAVNTMCKEPLNPNLPHWRRGSQMLACCKSQQCRAKRDYTHYDGWSSCIMLRMHRTPKQFALCPLCNLIIELSKDVVIQGAIAIHNGIHEITTKLTPCPQCDEIGESQLEETELTCPHCGHEWTVVQQYETLYTVTHYSSMRWQRKRWENTVTNLPTTLPQSQRTAATHENVFIYLPIQFDSVISFIL